jgi:hypothetical protein
MILGGIFDDNTQQTLELLNRLGFSGSKHQSNLMPRLVSYCGENQCLLAITVV